MRYYCIFAINKNNPDIILGLGEGSFTMPWLKDRVCLWQAPDEDSKFISIPHKQYFNNKIRKDNPNIFQYGYNWGESVNIKGKRRKYRKLISDENYQYYHACGRSNHEYEWHWVKHFAKRMECPEGYEILVCRANSKYCPVIIDTSEREGMWNKVIPYDKFKFRNAKFKLKS